MAGRTGSIVGAKCVPQSFLLERSQRNSCLGSIAHFCQGIRNFTVRLSSTCSDTAGLEGDSDRQHAVISHRGTVRVFGSGSYGTQRENHDRPLPQRMAIQLQIDSRHHDSARVYLRGEFSDHKQGRDECLSRRKRDLSIFHLRAAATSCASSGDDWIRPADRVAEWVCLPLAHEAHRYAECHGNAMVGFAREPRGNAGDCVAADRMVQRGKFLRVRA